MFKRSVFKRPVFKSSLALCLLAMLAWTQSGCAPPSSSPRSGREIIKVKPGHREPFKTVVVNGAELMQARGPMGQFGGAFSTSQIGAGPKTFNPWASFDATSSFMGRMTLSSLVVTDPYSGEIIPYLAKSVRVDRDQKTYVVTLRKGLQWSDGHPLTADDVVFTWNEIIRAGLGNASHRDSLLVDGQFPTIRKLDDLTMEFKTAKPFAPFLRNLGEPIAPAHILKPVVAKGNEAFSAAWGVDDAAHHPERFVSSGMWLLERYESRQRAIFKRNPRFFMVDAKGRRLPYIERYIMHFLGDSNNEQLQFEQGRLDSYSPPGKSVARIRNLDKPAFRLYNMGPSTGTMFMTLNLNRRKDAHGKPHVDPVRSAWFNDVNFRQAINHAINREDIVANILKGVGAPLFTAESLSSLYLNQKLAKGFPTDINYSKSLLKKSGFTWDNHGNLHDRAGHLVEFTLLTNTDNEEREAVGVNIKEDLAQLGMKVHFKPIDFNVLVGNLTEGSWEAIIIALTGDNLEPHSGVNVWRSDGSLHLFNQRVVKPGKKTDISDRLPWEVEIDRAFTEGAQTLDVKKRHEIYDRFQQIVYDQAPMIYLYSPLRILAVKERIRNFDPTPLEDFHNMEEIWIDPKQQ